MFKLLCPWTILLYVSVTLQPTIGQTQVDPTTQSLVDSIQQDIEQIRGEKFKHRVKVANQSLADFGKYLDKMLDKQFSTEYGQQYGKVIRKLGLYRGPEIEDFKSMAKMVMQSQAAAYYDPAKNTFFVVMQNLPQSVMKSVYAHELYHGFQDQYHNLDRFILSAAEGDLNDDELLARQALVEGEATYLMTLWTFKKQFGSMPKRSLLEMAVNMQAKLDVKKILEMLQGGSLPLTQGPDMENAIKAMEDIPPFMIETMIGAYLKGMAFVFQIQEQGWQIVDKLYERPPASSEQILHPGKWTAGEYPYRFTWPAFAGKLFTDWKLLESNTIGEIQWRIIFSVHGLAEIGMKAAEGWDGDLFAVLQNQKSDRLLLLICSSWDSEAEAIEFVDAYNKLLKVKYAEDSEIVQVEREGRDVRIIEGGSEAALSGLVSFMKKVGKVKKG